MKRAIQLFSSRGFSWTAFCEKLGQGEKRVRRREEERCGDLGGNPKGDVKPTSRPPLYRQSNRLSKEVFAVLFVLAIMRFFGPLHYDPKATAYRSSEAVRVGYNFYKTGDWTNPFGPLATGPTAHVAPAFPVLLATTYHIFGEGARGKFAVDLLEATVLTLQVSLLPILARSMGLSLSLGFIAEILAIACVRRDVFWEHSYVALLLVVVTIAACRYLRVIEQPGTRMLRRPLMAPSSAVAGAAAVGILWGLLLLTGPNTGLVWAGWLAVGAIYSWRCGFRTAWLPAVILPLLMLAPWTWRNYRVLGHPVLVRSDLGLELMVSNNASASYSAELNHQSQGFLENHPNANPAAGRLVLALGEVNYNRMKFDQAVVWIRQNQRQFWRLTGMRFVLFWFPTGTGRVRDMLHSDPRNPVSAWVLYPATVLSVPGIFLLWRTHRKAAWLCLSFFILFPPIYYIVAFGERRRYPITWVTCLVAAYPIDLILRRWRATHETEPRSPRVLSSEKDDDD